MVRVTKFYSSGCCCWIKLGWTTSKEFYVSEMFNGTEFEFKMLQKM